MLHNATGFDICIPKTITPIKIKNILTTPKSFLIPFLLPLSCLHPVPGTLMMCFLSLEIGSHDGMKRIMYCFLFLGLASLAQHNYFETHSSCCRYQRHIPLCC